MRVPVTRAQGFIGSEVVASVAGAGHPPAVCRSGRADPRFPGVEAPACDVERMTIQRCGALDGRVSMPSLTAPASCTSRAQVNERTPVTLFKACGSAMTAPHVGLALDGQFFASGGRRVRQRHPAHPPARPGHGRGCHSPSACSSWSGGAGCRSWRSRCAYAHWRIYVAARGEPLPPHCRGLMRWGFARGWPTFAGAVSIIVLRVAPGLVGTLSEAFGRAGSVLVAGSWCRTCDPSRTMAHPAFGGWSARTWRPTLAV